MHTNHNLNIVVVKINTQYTTHISTFAVNSEPLITVMFEVLGYYLFKQETCSNDLTWLTDYRIYLDHAGTWDDFLLLGGERLPKNLKLVEKFKWT